MYPTGFFLAIAQIHQIGHRSIPIHASIESIYPRFRSESRPLVP